MRERAGDIPLLAQHFINVYAKDNGKTIEGLTPDAMDVLTSYPWPGNVRELRNTIERMVVMGRGSRLTVRDLPPQVRESAAASAPSDSGRGYLSLEETEKQLIIKSLKVHGGNRTKAAAELGISRRTLHRKLNEYGLHEKETTIERE